MTIIILILELVLLWIVSKRLTQNLYIALFLLTTSRPVSISLLSVLFFPGTVIHELSHLFVAEISGVRTGGLTLVPEALDQPDVRTGSVSIAQTDPVRRAIIGIAPVFSGLLGLFVLSYYLPTVPFPWTLLLSYGLFAISNTMFSSKEDMEGFWPVATVILILGIAMYITGIRISLTEQISSVVTDIGTRMVTATGWVAAANTLLFFCTKLLISIVEHLTKRRIIQ